MGVVYKARDTHLHRLVAISFFRPTWDRDRRLRSSRKRRRLERSIIQASYDPRDRSARWRRLHRPGVRPRSNVGRIIPRRGLSLNDTIDHRIQVADALAAAHAVGSVHRDLKPSNVIVTSKAGSNPRLWPGEAGRSLEARLAARDERPMGTHLAAVTAQGVIVGTVAYMSPEETKGKTVDARSDVFSVGSMLYERATGQRGVPRRLGARNPTAVLREDPRLSVTSARISLTNSNAW